MTFTGGDYPDAVGLGQCLVSSCLLQRCSTGYSDSSSSVGWRPEQCWVTALVSSVQQCRGRECRADTSPPAKPARTCSRATSPSLFHNRPPWPKLGSVVTSSRQLCNRSFCLQAGNLGHSLQCPTVQRDYSVMTPHRLSMRQLTTCTDEEAMQLACSDPLQQAWSPGHNVK